MGGKVTTVQDGREVWRYGDAGDRWPVRDGDIWQVGDHVVACGDNGRGASAELMDLFGAPDYVYSDPPWNQGNVNSFRTKAGLQPDRDGFAQFLLTFSGVVTRARAAFIEMGRKELSTLDAAMTSRGWAQVRIWDIVYFGDKPCVLSLYAPAGSSILTQVLTGDPTGMDDALTPGWAVPAISKPGDVIFDPCMGRGCTAEHSSKAGRLVRGVELHPRRLACTIDKLVKVTGATPVKVGDLACMK